MIVLSNKILLRRPHSKKGKRQLPCLTLSLGMVVVAEALLLYSGTPAVVS